MRALIELGADFNKTQDNDVTPLYITAQNGHEAIVRALVELGADINKAGNGGVTALFITAQNGYETVVGRLSSWVQTSTRRRKNRRSSWPQGGSAGADRCVFEKQKVV